MIDDKYIYMHLKGLKYGLELGCGYGDFMTKLLRIGYKVYGVDKCSYCIKYANRSFRNSGFNSLCYRMYAESLSFSDETFDFIYVITSLHEMNMEKAVREAYRVLRKGRLFIDIDWAPWADTGVPEKYLSIEELIEIFTSIGFRIRESYYRDEIEYMLCEKPK